MEGPFWAPELDPKGLILRHKSLTFFHKSVSLCQKSHISFQKRIVFIKKAPYFRAISYYRIYVTAGEGQFLRKGQVGDWTNYFSKEQNARMDAWIERNSAGHDLPLVYHPDAADV